MLYYWDICLLRFPSLYGKSEKSPYLCEKSKPFGEKVCYIAKKYIIAEKYTFIAKRFNYAELYQAYGHYTLTQQGLKPILLLRITIFATYIPSCYRFIPCTIHIITFFKKMDQVRFLIRYIGKSKKERI